MDTGWGLGGEVGREAGIASGASGVLLHFCLLRHSVRRGRVLSQRENNTVRPIYTYLSLDCFLSMMPCFFLLRFVHTRTANTV